MGQALLCEEDKMGRLEGLGSSGFERTQPFWRCQSLSLENVVSSIFQQIGGESRLVGMRARVLCSRVVNCNSLGMQKNEVVVGGGDVSNEGCVRDWNVESCNKLPFV